VPSALPRFAIDQPRSLEEASQSLQSLAGEACAYAGGTELLLAMKYAGLRFSRLVDLKTIGGLDAVEATPAGLRIGALATHRTIETSELVRKRLPVLAELESHVANPRVRASGTLGGNLCFAEPHSDPAVLLQCLDARLQTTSRELPLEAFIVGPYETALAEGELLVSVLVPWPAPTLRACYRKIQFHERPMLGLALAVDGRDVRVAIGSASPTARRSPAAESLLANGKISEAAEALVDQADLIDDLEGSAEYKRQLIHVELARAWDSLA
jgi:aerobic carbon-monoxide dehydrogenase medium subunit